MATVFDGIGFQLDGRIAELPESMRPLAFLALAERYLSIFELYEKQRNLTGSLRECLDVLWSGAREHGAAMVAVTIERLVPDEYNWLDGFHDALAQSIGGVAYSAAVGYAGGYEPGASGVLDALRVLLSESTLGRLEPGQDAAGSAFDASLHQHEVVVNELREIKALVDAVAAGATVAQMKALASRSPFAVAILEPALSRGLQREMEEVAARRNAIRRK
jgi:hypothetical protein